MIQSEESLRRLAELVRVDPNIANWIHKVRIDVYPQPPDDADLSDLSDEEDMEDYEGRWIYQFPSVLGVTPPNVRILDSFNLRLSIISFARTSKISPAEFLTWQN